MTNFEKSIMIAKNMFLSVLDFFLPTRCLICGVFTQVPSLKNNLTQPSLCSTCWQKLSFITTPYCKACAAPLSFDGDSCGSCRGKIFNFDSASAALVYNDTAKHLITRFKHSGKTGYARLFTPWMQAVLARDPKHYDGIVPVPLHFWRLCKRGYNQATLLAHELCLKQKQNCEDMHAPLLNRTPLLNGALKRVRYTPSQGHRSALDRVKNIEKSIIADPKMVLGRRILLVDDVMTTGATLNECARVLKQSGAARVDVLVLARAVT